jgi:biopolymer transport protein ExbB/TolQ
MFQLPFALPSMAKVYLIGGLLLILTLSHTGVYFYGKAVMRTEIEAKNVKVLVDELEKEQEDGRKIAKQAEETGREVAEMEAQMDRALEELNEAIRKANRANCPDVSPAELDGLRDLYDSYR